MVLTVSQNSVTDNLTGSTGGAYRYFQLAYQGGSSPVLVSLNFLPGSGITGAQAFGFNIYGPNGITFAGQNLGSNNSNSSTTTQYTVVQPAAMTLLVQIYNYTAGLQVGYTLTVSGLSGGTTSTVTTANNTTPEQATNVSSVNARLGGALPGNTAGAFQYYSLSYTGGNSPLTITMNASPSYNATGQGYGFNVYQPNVNGNAPTLVATSVQSSKDVNSETLTATIANLSATTYQLQVFNYWAGVTVNFGITATGLSGSTVSAQGNLDSSHAVVLNSATPGATETLVGQASGVFNYYLVQYPGNNSAFAISITAPSTSATAPGTIGFNVYEGATLKATAHTGDDGNGSQSGAWNFTDANPHTYGIQVFNYAPGVTLSYKLYESGAQ
jgi:hypothetical protein